MIDTVGVRAAIEPTIVNAGYEIVDIEVKKQYGGDVLTVYVFKNGGVSLDDCEKINGLIDSLLEEFDPTEGRPYTLNVSSPGLDRPIVTEDDLRRSKGEDVEALFFKAIDGKNKVHGILSEYDAETVTLAMGHKTFVLNRNSIKLLQKYIKF